MSFDTTAANTGRFSGACILLEAILDRSLLWIACRHRMLEVVLSQVFKAIFGDSVGTSDELFQQLKNQWQSVDFTQSTYHLNQSTTACLQEDVKHAYQSLVKIKLDPSYLPRDDYEECSIWQHITSMKNHFQFFLFVALELNTEQDGCRIVFTL